MWESYSVYLLSVANTLLMSNNVRGCCCLSAQPIKCQAFSKKLTKTHKKHTFFTSPLPPYLTTKKHANNTHKRYDFTRVSEGYFPNTYHIVHLFQTDKQIALIIPWLVRKSYGMLLGIELRKTNERVSIQLQLRWPDESDSPSDSETD